MKKLLYTGILAVSGLVLTTGCSEEILPQSSTVLPQQIAAVPSAYDSFVLSLTNTMTGRFLSTGESYDFGYPMFFLMRDIMGQDLVPEAKKNKLRSWYRAQYMGTGYRNAQIPWEVYYGWIKTCNIVLNLSGENPQGNKAIGAGLAYAMRALFYLDLAQYFSQETYTVNKESVSVPIVTEKSSIADLENNPRATHEKMFEFILSDLNQAEKLLENYIRPDKTTPDKSVVYGLKARAYLLMGEWAKAVEYARKAQEGYTMLTTEQYLDRNSGFNTPTDSWMFCSTYKPDDPNIKTNDADSSWGSYMCLEVDPDDKVSGCGYASNYGYTFAIDRHLYETIPATDIRKKCFIDFSIDDLTKKSDIINKLSEYSDYANNIYTSFSRNKQTFGGKSLKFRLANGDEGRRNQYKGFLISVPFMRVEEMYLIEAEAAGRLNEADGIAKLTAFAQKRDPNYVYGTHQDAYGNLKTSAFINEIWWQRRVEFWAEGFTLFDIKRLGKGIIRSYPNTNHSPSYRYNLDTVPQWMVGCFPSTESKYNPALVLNPNPEPPTGDSPEFKW